MSMRTADGLVELFLSPPGRAAPDDLRTYLLPALGKDDAELAIASQQVADRGLVEALADIRSARKSRARVFIESRFLSEATPVPAHQIWDPVGEREPNRQCLAALNRAGIEVRADVVAGALQHMNMVVIRGRSRPSELFLTSANLSPGSLDRHLNWGVRCLDHGSVTAAWTLFESIWGGDFRGATMSAPLGQAGALGRIVAGAQGEAVSEIEGIVGEAATRIRFAVFSMSRDTRLVRALIEAAERGVDVAGIVDADQGGQPWNAVPQLRAGGVDARYFPGALTGASGRMHHKTLVVDRLSVFLSTANASKAAESSLELGVTLVDEGAAAYVEAEILRLAPNASIAVIAPR